MNLQQAVVSEETKCISNSQNETITVQMLENVDVSTGEVPEAPKKAYNPIAKHELQEERSGRLRKRPKFLDVYVVFQSVWGHCNEN